MCRKEAVAMLPEQLVNLVRDVIQKKYELQHIELKRAEKGTPENLYDTLSSFSNQAGGGTIIFGIHEKDDFEITGVFDAQYIQVQVTNQALQMQPSVRPVFTVAQIDENLRDHSKQGASQHLLPHPGCALQESVAQKKGFLFHSP